METQPSLSLKDYFADLPDCRLERCKEHKLIDIVMIGILATICGAEHFTEMQTFGEAKHEWLKTFLELKNGIPSHDTFGRVFARLDPAAFQERFIRWTQALRTATADEVIGLDGKTARRSHDKAKGLKALHLVSAWASTNRLVLGQLKVDQKSNEMTVVPELLRLLDLKGCIVTADALNTHKKIAAEAREQGAEYILALKENHPILHAEVTDIFEVVREEDHAVGGLSTAATVEQNHGRIESRRCWSIEAPECLTGFAEWRDLRSLILLESTREVRGNSSTELRYYLSSLAPDAERATKAIRQHWGIENSLHWVLDVAFHEDASRVRMGNAPENLALVRKITHNLLQQETTHKRGVKSKRFLAALDEDYLLKVLHLIPTES